MRFSKLEMKSVEFSFLLTEYKIISGGIRKVIYWSLNWYMYKLIRFFFSGKLLVFFFFPVVVWILRRSFPMMAEHLIIK